ncbi:MAG: hypothetical protein ACKVUS_09825 [Saprospiraceae bacterium]
MKKQATSDNTTNLDFKTLCLFLVSVSGVLFSALVAVVINLQKVREEKFLLVQENSIFKAQANNSRKEGGESIVVNILLNVPEHRNRTDYLSLKREEVKRKRKEQTTQQSKKGIAIVVPMLNIKEQSSNPKADSTALKEYRDSERIRGVEQ